jgi:hypothetical protein
MPHDRPCDPRFVAYYCVSTDQQARSGLALDARREAVARPADTCGGSVVVALKEVVSGRRGDRPQLAPELAECRLRRCVLLIAELNRLARDAHFLLGVEKAGVEFLAAGMPYAVLLQDSKLIPNKGEDAPDQIMSRRQLEQ